jgi:hypothetical protein
MNASFEEKSVWITMVATCVILGGYFLVAARMLSEGITDAVVPYVPLFAVATLLLVIVLVIGHVVVAVASRPDGRDERDRLVSWRAENNSSWVLAVGVLAAAFCLALPIGRAWIANGLLLALFASEILKHALQICYYRRGM